MPLQARGDPGLVYACMTHVPLTVAYPSFVTPIHLGQSQGPGRLNLRDLAPEWEPHHPILGGTAGSFALRQLLLTRYPDAKRVGICQYRKFVSRRRISQLSDPHFHTMDFVHRAALEGLDLAQLLDPGEQPFLVTAPLCFSRWPWRRKGYLHQYARYHHAEEFLRFTAEAVAQGVLRSDEVVGFFGEDVFIPGGIELGVFPADFWLRSIGAVEGVLRACIARYPVAHDGYQARAWSFCAERLGSHLLLKEFRAACARTALARRLHWLSQREWQKRFTGRLNTITEDEGARNYAGGT